jgi:hypothetical protein
MIKSVQYISDIAINNNIFYLQILIIFKSLTPLSLSKLRSDEHGLSTYNSPLRRSVLELNFQRTDNFLIYNTLCFLTSYKYKRALLIDCKRTSVVARVGGFLLLFQVHTSYVLKTCSSKQHFSIYVQVSKVQYRHHPDCSRNH